jgi:hypothetical protein
MIVERGTIADWHLLHELHYKSAGTPSAARIWRLRLGDDTIGALVMGAPKPLLKERHACMRRIKPGGAETKLTNTHRYNWMNANVRVIARLVVDVPYRGVGVGYRFMNLASRLENFRYIEILSSMSKYNLFGPAAGFSFMPPMTSLKFDQGVKFFKSHFRSHPSDLIALMEELDGMRPFMREKTLKAVRDFYSRNSALENTGNARLNSEARIAAKSPEELIKSLQQLVLASPLYGLWESPDYALGVRQMPTQLPLSTFDEQPPTAPLKRLSELL